MTEPLYTLMFCAEFVQLCSTHSTMLTVPIRLLKSNSNFYSLWLFYSLSVWFCPACFPAFILCLLVCPSCLTKICAIVPSPHHPITPSFYFCATLLNSCLMSVTQHPIHSCLNVSVPGHVHLTLSSSCLLLCCCLMSVALSPFAVILVIPCPMSISLCPSAVYSCVVVSCLWHLVHLLPYSSCHAPMSISFFPKSVFCYAAVLLSVALGPFAVLLVMSCPMSVSLCPLAVFCYAAVPLSVALGPFAVLLVMSCPMSVSLCPLAVFCYVVVPCLWHSVHLLSCNVMSHVRFTVSISCLLFMLLSPCLWHSVHLLSCNVMSHVRFTVSISCLLLCCCPMSVALRPQPIAVLLVMSCPTSVSLWPLAVSFLLFFSVPVNKMNSESGSESDESQWALPANRELIPLQVFLSDFDFSLSSELDGSSKPRNSSSLSPFPERSECLTEFAKNYWAKPLWTPLATHCLATPTSAQNRKNN